MAIETRVNLTRNAGTRIAYASSVAPITRQSTAGLVSIWRGMGGTTLMSSGNVSTGTGLVTAEYPVDDKIAFLVSWGATVALNAAQAATCVLNVSAGTLRRGYKRDIGDFNLRLAQNVAGLSTATTGMMMNRFVVGPFETAQFAMESASTVHAPVGRNYVRFRYSGAAATSSGPNQAQARRCNIRAFEMPIVRYAT